MRDSSHGRLKLARFPLSLIATSLLYLLSRKSLSSIVRLPLHRPNGAYGKSDVEGKTAMEAASKLGKELVSNARQHMSQSAGSERVSIEGTDFRDRRQSREVAATECG